MKPMLAAKTEGKNLTYPLMVSPKLDGVRAIVLNGSVYSRALKRIPNRHVQATLGRPALNGWDGELCVGPPTAHNVYRRTVSAVMSEDGEPDFCFWAFDRYDLRLPYYRRYEKIKRSQPNVRWLQVLNHFIMDSEEALVMYEQDRLADGFEGVMIRHPEGPYKFGRSTEREAWLMKLKRFEDGEAEIIEIVELMHNDNEAKFNRLGKMERSSHKVNKRGGDTMGSIRVRDVRTKVEFDIGTGFDASLRKTIWAKWKTYIGRTVKYKYFPGGVKDKPRFPVFLGFRAAIDMS